jgi:putative DNA primase/helicase
MGYQTFREAADDVRDFFGTNPNVKPVPREQQIVLGGAMTPEVVLRNRTRMLRLWDEGQKITRGDPVDLYLRLRVKGINFLPENIRFHPALPYWAPPPEGSDRPVLLGRFPSMLAYAQAPDGSLAQLHKTYLTREGVKADVPVVKKTELGVGVNSFAVRMLEPTGDTLGVCEGIETGCASAMLRDIPVWPCLNGPAMSEFELPHDLLGQVKKLVIFEDADSLKAFGRNQDGTVKLRSPGAVYAHKLAERARKWGLRTLIIKSARVGDDIADYWNENSALSKA